jgi:hypothetical protein
LVPQAYFLCELPSTVLCLLVIGLYGALTFWYRNEGAISVRGTLFLVYLYGGAPVYCVATALQFGYYYGVLTPLYIAPDGYFVTGMCP